MQILDFFDYYADFGLKTIPLWPRSKAPIHSGWYKNWNKELCRDFFIHNPDANIGLILGDLVDVEGDTEEANDLINNLIGDVPHPQYKSSKSIHHIFVNPDPGLIIWKHQGIEFRGYKHQSVLPPSCHKDGTNYIWIESDFPAPKMPKSLLEYYKNRHNINRPKIKEGYIRPWCSKCNVKQYIHKKRYFLESQAFSLIQTKWQCHDCREYDVRQMCRKIKKLNK